MGKMIAIIGTVSATLVIFVTTFVLILTELAPYASINISGWITGSPGVNETAEIDITGGVEIMGLKTPNEVTIENEDTIRINYYDPEGYLLGGGSDSDSDWGPNEEQLKVAKEVFRALKGDGFSDASAIAVIANLQAESGMNASSHEVGNTEQGRGLGQWSYDEDRFARLEEIAEEMGTTWEDPKAQIKLILEEVKSETTWIHCLSNCHSAGASENFCDAYKEGLDQQHAGYTMDDFKEMTNAENATIIFCNHYERPLYPGMDGRLKYAKVYSSLLTNAEKGVKANIVGKIDRNTLVDIPNKEGQTGWKTTFTGSINGWPVETEGYAYMKNVAQSGGSGYRIMINTDGYYGIKIGGGGGGSMGMVETALAEVGNVGGKKYKDYLHLSMQQPWCAAFVTWCGNENGYVESGVMQYTASCGTIDFYMANDQYHPRNGSFTPSPGDLIFFDWPSDGMDGLADHIGIVEFVESVTVHTIEGNTGGTSNVDSLVLQRTYPVDSPYILGYATPAY